jgi:hypothetical protein
MTSMTSATHAAHSVGSVLATTHEAWIKRMTRSLVPATDLHSDFWSRWGAVRFLADQFGDHFRSESAFAAALELLISPDDAARLGAARKNIERIREELMAAGRRRDTPELTAVLARRLINEVACWCVELELATEHLATAELPLAARRMLARLRFADAIGR